MPHYLMGMLVGGAHPIRYHSKKYKAVPDLHIAIKIICYSKKLSRRCPEIEVPDITPAGHLNHIGGIETDWLPGVGGFELANVVLRDMINVCPE
jgi:hypothetical protein